MLSLSILNVPTILADDDFQIPQWFKNNAKWVSEDKINEADFLNSIQHLIKKEIIIVNFDLGIVVPENPIDIPEWFYDSVGYWADGINPDEQFADNILSLYYLGVFAKPNSNEHPIFLPIICCPIERSITKEITIFGNYSSQYIEWGTLLTFDMFQATEKSLLHLDNPIAYVSSSSSVKIKIEIPKGDECSFKIKSYDVRSFMHPQNSWVDPKLLSDSSYTAECYDFDGNLRECDESTISKQREKAEEERKRLKETRKWVLAHEQTHFDITHIHTLKLINLLEGIQDKEFSCFKTNDNYLTKYTEDDLLKTFEFREKELMKQIREVLKQAREMQGAFDEVYKQYKGEAQDNVVGNMWIYEKIPELLRIEQTRIGLD